MSETQVIDCGGCGKKFTWAGSLVPVGAVCLACFERNRAELKLQHTESSK